MEQITHVVEHGQRNYTLIEGGTGPIVYPAGHVAIYTLLWYATSKGTDLLKAQYIFLGLYILTHAIVLLFVFSPTSIADSSKDISTGVSGNLLQPSTAEKKAKVASPTQIPVTKRESLWDIAKATPSYVWAVALLALSKRLHSIYVLRLFNDCFTTFFVVIAVALTQRHKWTLSAIFLSLAVSVKMNALLYLPGAAIIYLQALGLFAAAKRTAIPFILVQLVIALPFLVDFTPLTTLIQGYIAQQQPLVDLEGAAVSATATTSITETVIPLVTSYVKAIAEIPVMEFGASLAQVCVSPYAHDYLGRAFEFSRVFFYKWTVNWRFVPEETFLSPTFAQALLALHLGILVLGFASHKAGWWFSPLRPALAVKTLARSEFSLASLVRSLFFETSRPALARRVAQGMDPDYILTTLVSSNLVGVLCARSLHYQFYSWFYWSLPYALYRVSKVYTVPSAVVIWAAQEWAWNTYPSTTVSSAVVVGSLALIVFGLWLDGYQRYRAIRSQRGLSNKKNA